MNESKRTSLMRYRRVGNVLQNDRLLSQKLSTEMVGVGKHDQTHEDFPAEVVYVTDEIHKQGVDAYTMPKNDILRIAHRLLIQNPSPVSKPDLEPQPKATAARAAAAAAATTTTTTKVKVKVAQAPKPQRGRRKRKTAVHAEEIAPAVQPESAGGAPIEDRPPPPPPPSSSSSSSSKPVEYVRPFIPYVVGVAILSLLQAVLTLFEPFMSNGAEGDTKDVCQKVNELIDEIHRRTVIPASAEKESKPKS